MSQLIRIMVIILLIFLFTNPQTSPQLHFSIANLPISTNGYRCVFQFLSQNLTSAFSPDLLQCQSPRDVISFFNSSIGCLALLLLFLFLIFLFIFYSFCRYNFQVISAKGNKALKFMQCQVQKLCWLQRLLLKFITQFLF